MPDDLSIRVSLLEDSHQDLKAEMTTTAQALHTRIAITEEALRAMRAEQADARRDTATSLAQIQATLMSVQADAFQSLPKWAADERALAARRAESDSKTKGMMLGGIISLIGVIVVLSVAMWTHHI